MNDPIEYRTGDIPTTDALVELYHSVEWPHADTPEELYAAVEQSGWVATAWHGSRLVGLARVLTDGVFDVFLQDLVVHRDYQHQGVGKELLDLYDRTFSGFPRQVIVTDAEWAGQKLGKRGFRAEPAALSRSRSYAAWKST